MRPFLRITAAASALCLAGPAASWALTAEEAWEAWVSIAAQYGESVSAAETSRSGNVLTASGVAVSMQLEEMSIAGDLGDVILTENGDGTVAIAVPESFRLDLTVAPEYGEKVEAVLDFTAAALDLTAADGEAGGVVFTYASPEIGFSLAEMTVDGQAAQVSFDGSLKGNSGNYTGGGEDEVMSSQFRSDLLEISFQGRDPEGKGRGQGSVTVADIVSSSTGQGQLMFMAPEQIPALLKAGASVAGTTTVGASTFSLEGVEEGNAFAMSGDIDSGQATVGLDAEQLAYAISYNGFDVSISGSEIPLPEVTLGLGETRLDLIFPLAQSDAPKPYMLAVALKELTIADGIWNMIDPGTVLPRDPATLTFNLAGTGNWLIDVFDEAATANPERMPAEVHSLNISDVKLEAAGAEFTAAGSFTFDNSDLMTFNGMPAPDGKINATLLGGDTLMDNLVKMGLMPADQAAGIKLGAGMFATRDPASDKLTTEIGVSSDGTVTANGIPIPIQ